MKSIFALVFGLFMAISSFSQVESLLASIEIFDATQVEIVETDTVEAVISECDPLGEMSFSEFIETDCAFLEPIECEMIVMENIDHSTLEPVIETLVTMEKFEMSVSDLERTPDSVQNFVESVNDSTIFIAETENGFIAVNSTEELGQYEKLIMADTIKINDNIFVFDSTKVADFKSFVNENYFVASTEECLFSINSIAGYTLTEEIAKDKELVERKQGGNKVQAEPKILPKKSRETKVDLAETKPAKPEAVFQFVSSPKEIEEIHAEKHVSVSVPEKVEGKNSKQSGIATFFVALLCILMFAFFILPFVVILRGKKVVTFLSPKGKRMVVKYEPSFMRWFRKRRKSYNAEPAEEGARIQT